MFGRLGEWARRVGPWALAAALLATVWIVRFSWPPRVEMDLSTLFPRTDPSLRNFEYFQRNYGVAEMLVAVCWQKSAENEAKMRALANWMREQPCYTSAELLPLPGGIEGWAILAFPARPSTDHDFCRLMLQALRSRIAQDAVPVELTGGAVMATEGLERLTHDMNISTVISLGGIVLIVFLFIRDPIFPLFAVVPLVLGIIWTMAFAQWRFGPASMLISTLPTTLLGMGIDYTVYLRNCRREFPADTPGVWQLVFARVGPPMLIGVLTTAVAIFSLCSAYLTGLARMGLVGGAGILLIFLLIMLLMPTLLDWRERVGWRVRPPSDAWIGWVAQQVVRHRNLTLAAFALISVPLLYQAMQLRYGMDPRDYRDSTIPSLRTFQEFEDKVGFSLEAMLLATEKGNKAERAVIDGIRPLVGKGEDCPFGFIDSLTERMDRLDANPPVRRFVGKEDQHRLIMLCPRTDPYEGDRLPEMVKTMKEVVAKGGENVKAYSGMPLIWYALMTHARRDLARTTVLAGAAVLVVLVLLMRRVRSILAALVPLVGSLIWMLGVMHAAGYKFSLISAISLPLVMGLGIGYGVYIVHRLRDDTVEQSVVVVGRSIIVSAATTAMAFFALCAGTNPAIRGMGLAAGVGVLSCLLWSLLFLPAWAAIINQRRLTAGAADGSRES